MKSGDYRFLELAGRVAECSSRFCTRKGEIVCNGKGRASTGPVSQKSDAANDLSLLVASRATAK
jgi:hypothetical protein